MPRVSAKIDFNGDLIELGKAVRRARKSRDISQEDLAVRCGLDRSNMGKIERGERNLTTLTLLRIARELDLTLTELAADACL